MKKNKKVIPDLIGCRQATPQAVPQGMNVVNNPTGHKSLLKIMPLDNRVKPAYDKEHQSGRSMVEMIAVLVIAGILTVGGITGFHTAINKIRANTIGEAIAEVSVEAQTHNTCLSLEDLDDLEMPKCVLAIKGGRTGQVSITFENTDSCTYIKELVGNTFGKCRWETDGEGYLFIPNRGKKCTKTQCSDECENFVKDNCFK